MKLSNAFQQLLLAIFTVLLSLFPTFNATAATAPAAPVAPVAPLPATYDPTAPGTGKAAPVTAVPVAPAIPPSPAKLLLDGARASNNMAFIWEVKSKTNVIYLFGTIHVGKRTFFPLPPQVEEALKQSQVLVVEADISSSEGLGDIGSVINYKTPDSLDKHLPAALFERLKGQLVRLHIPLDAVRPMKPYLIGGFLSIAEFSKLGYDRNFGVDGYLLAKAKEGGKPILELESQVGQLNMLNGMSPLLQEAFLENAISVLESGNAPDQVTGMVNAWQSGDVALMQAVAKSVNAGARLNDQLDEVLIYGRHDEMMKKLVSYLDGRTPHFVAVGSLHLVGPRGLVELLKARGYEVKQL